MLNVMLVLFLLLMVYWWSEQGLFSAVIHLLVTIVAGLIALAVWEPITLGLLIEHLPDHAWGTGLLLPFAVAMLALRYVTDKYVPSNLDFQNILDRIGGAVVGFGSGVLTAGLIVIGMQMTGMPDFFGYQPWDLNDRQQPEREERLVVPVDDIAANFFGRLSDGAMAPLFSGNTASRYYRNLAVQAALFNSPSFAPSRRVLQPEHLQPIEGEPLYSVNELPPSLEEHDDLALAGDERLVVVGTHIILRDANRRGAADYDGNFRATPHQVALAYDRPNGGTDFAHPLGIIQRGDFQPITIAGTYTTALGDDMRTHWVFRVPDGADPRFVRVKHARLDLPAERVEQVAEVEGLITYDRTAVAERSESPSEPATGGSTGSNGDFASVSASLPTVDRSLLQRQNVEVEDNVLYSGQANISDPGRPGQNLRVNRIHHADNARIVQVRLGERTEGSLLSRIISTATAAAEAPVLYDHHGTRYFPIGYIVREGRGFRFAIDPGRSFRSLSDLDIGRVSEGEEMMLVYQVEAGVRVTEFRYGDDTRELNLNVPRPN